jgi:hypothetical protein
MACTAGWQIPDVMVPAGLRVPVSHQDGSLGIGLLANFFTVQSTAAGPVAALHQIAVIVAVLAGTAVVCSAFLPEAGVA